MGEAVVHAPRYKEGTRHWGSRVMLVETRTGIHFVFYMGLTMTPVTKSASKSTERLSYMKIFQKQISPCIDSLPRGKALLDFAVERLSFPFYPDTTIQQLSSSEFFETPASHLYIFFVALCSVLHGHISFPSVTDWAFSLKADFPIPITCAMPIAVEVLQWRSSLSIVYVFNLWTKTDPYQRKFSLQPRTHSSMSLNYVQRNMMPYSPRVIH